MTERDKSDAHKGDKPPPEKLKPDAIAIDSVLSLLKQPLGDDVRPRTMSAGSRAEMDAQTLQLQFQSNRAKLEKYLVQSAEMLNDIVELNREAPLSVPDAELNVLHVDVKLGSSSLGAAGIAPDVVESKLRQVLRHTKRLEGRLQDSISRVLVTGDLNAGKSSLCNTLLRRQILPVDQQPCTDVFCEVIDCQKNGGIEEVHAVHLVPQPSMNGHTTNGHTIGLANNLVNGTNSHTHSSPESSDGTSERSMSPEWVSRHTSSVFSDEPLLGITAPGVYDIHDRQTYDTLSLEELPDLVHRSDKYKLLVIYVKDPRAPSESLLANGIVDICLIDAPGLNVNEVTTTELFGRQEEIDLVIFVVSAENHFTQSAREFVADTAREKSLLFIAVNNFDRIRDKDRCRDRVLAQIKELAPETHKGAADFVHFMSNLSNPNDPDGDGNNGGRDPDALESSLRHFLLNKRSASKLAPARTFLINLLSDLALLARDNRAVSSHEQSELTKQLDELVPEIDTSMSEYAKVSEQLERDTERLCGKLQSDTEEKLNVAVSLIGEEPLIAWTGLFGVFSYANQTREALVQRVLDSVEQCENDARDATDRAVQAIKQVGVLHVGNRPAFEKVFQKSAMFSRRKDNLSRHITAEFGISDLFDIGVLLERPMPVLNSSKSALVSAAQTTSSLGSFATILTAVSAVTAVANTASSAWLPIAPLARGVALLGGPQRFACPLIALGVTSLGVWIVYELPRTIPRRLARKIAFELDDMGYVRSNAIRIAGEARKVLRYPTQDVLSAFQSKLETCTRQRDTYEQHLQQAEHILEVSEKLESQAKAAEREVLQLRI